MTTYYYEREKKWNKTEAISDQNAIEKLHKLYDDLVVIYKENEYSPDGTPFVVIWDEKHGSRENAS